MMSLHEIKKICLSYYPENTPDFAHLLFSWLLCDADGELHALLADVKTKKEKLLRALNPFLDKEANNGHDLMVSAVREAYGEISTGWHMLVALCRHKQHQISLALQEAGLDLDVLQRELAAHKRPARAVRPKHTSAANANAAAILKYGISLSERARRGTFDDLCSRPEEVWRLLEVLMCRQRGNVVLTGPAGVGKTSLVEVFARELADGKIQRLARETEIYALSMGRLVAGTKYRGQFEEKIESLFGTLQNMEHTIIFIDEMHLLWGAGSAEGIITDGGNLIKTYLDRGSLRIIGATTTAEYNRYIKQDPALCRRFKEIRLSAPDRAQTLSIVETQAEALLSHHGVYIPKRIIEHAIEITDRYVLNRVQPDKSVELLDNAAARIRLEDRKIVDMEALQQTFSKLTGIPVSNFHTPDTASLDSLTARLKKRIIGQDHVIERVCATLVQRRQGIGSPERNLGTFFFAGATGVGKTELARALAGELFGTADALLHVDLAEYSLETSINKLIGSPPGYAGSERDGIVADWLHRNVTGVLLFDEVEKAHPDVHNLLLGLLDNGRIRSARGELLDTRHCVVICTSNALRPEDLRDKIPGFHQRPGGPDPVKLLSGHFKPEFLARFDEILLFNSFKPEHLRGIIKLRLDALLAPVRENIYRLVYDEDRLLDHLMAGVMHNSSGARGIERFLEKKVLQPIARELLGLENRECAEIVFGHDFFDKGTVTVRLSNYYSTEQAKESLV